MPSLSPASRRSRPSRLARLARLLARGLRAPWARKRLWLRSLALVALVRLGLWTLPLRRLQVLAARLGRGGFSAPISMQGTERTSLAQSVSGEPGSSGSSGGEDAQADERELNWAITRAARFVPAASCLTQALSLQVVLGRRGLDSRLCIGVRKGKGDKFEAHAWVERGGRVLIGGEPQQGGRIGDQNAGREKWTPLTAWDFSHEPASSHGTRRDGSGRQRARECGQP